MPDRTAAARVDGALTHVLESGILSLARDLVCGLNVAVKTARIHDMRNEAVLSAVDAAVAPGNDLLRLAGPFTLKVLGDYLFWNDSRLRPDTGSCTAFESLGRELRSRGVGSLTVQQGLDRNALRALVGVLNSAPTVAPDADAETSGEAWKFLNDRLAALTPAITLGAYKPFDVTELEREQIDQKERAKKTFFRAVAVTRAIMSSSKVSQDLDLKRAKRVVQTMVDMLLEEEFSLLGLTTLREYDNYTFFHSVNVCILAIAVGKRLGLDRKRLSELGVAALLHDIGKTEISTNLIRKPGKFDRTEWETMKTHPALAVRVLVRLKGFSDLALKSIVASFEHHLGYDMSGYPPLLKPRVPHLFSRIVTIADCFDAMTTQRVYSEGAKPRDKAISFMLSQAGRLFDPIILKHFVNLIGVFPIGCPVRLDTGQLAVVMATHPGTADPRRPVIKVITDRNGIEIDGPLIDLAGAAGAGGAVPAIVGAVDPAQRDIDTSRYFL